MHLLPTHRERRRYRRALDQSHRLPGQVLADLGAPRAEFPSSLRERR